jgi:molybdate transport system regulatory protein
MELLSAEEAATLLHLNVKRVQALARGGRLPGRRIGRKWLFDRRDLDRLLGLGGMPLRPPAGLDISARNQLRGQVVAITLDGVMAEVLLRIGDQELVSIITRGSAERLGLAVGDEVFALIKSTEVMLGRGPVEP